MRGNAVIRGTISRHKTEKPARMLFLSTYADVPVVEVRLFDSVRVWAERFAC